MLHIFYFNRYTIRNRMYKIYIWSFSRPLPVGHIDNHLVLLYFCLLVLRVIASNPLGSSFKELHKKDFHHFSPCEYVLFPSSPASFCILEHLSSCVHALPSSSACSSFRHCCLPFSPACLPKFCQRQQSWLRIPPGFWCPGWPSEGHLEHFLKSCQWHGGGFVLPGWLLVGVLHSVESQSFLSRLCREFSVNVWLCCHPKSALSLPSLTARGAWAGHGWRCSWPKSSSSITFTFAHCFGEHKSTLLSVETLSFLQIITSTLLMYKQTKTNLSLKMTFILSCYTCTANI